MSRSVYCTRKTQRQQHHQPSPIYLVIPMILCTQTRYYTCNWITVRFENNFSFKTFSFSCSSSCAFVCLAMCLPKQPLYFAAISEFPHHLHASLVCLTTVDSITFTLALAPLSTRTVFPFSCFQFLISLF